MSDISRDDEQDLTGTVDERIAQLAEFDDRGRVVSEVWLRRQLDSALFCWASDATVVAIQMESRIDF